LALHSCRAGPVVVSDCAGDGNRIASIYERSAGREATHCAYFDKSQLSGVSNMFGLFLRCAARGSGPLTATPVSKPVLVSDPPETRSPVSSKAINDPHTGKAAFSFDGREDPPVIRANPGEEIHLTYTNAMSTHSQEHCVDGPCMNMTNLHFHGLHVSPDAPQDDAITMMAMDKGMMAKILFK
jgi:hypothetical protein